MLAEGVANQLRAHLITTSVPPDRPWVLLHMVGEWGPWELSPGVA